MKNEKIIVYEKPTCTKCRQTKKILDEAKMDYISVRYYEEPISVSVLQRLLKKLDMKPMELMRKKESIFNELNLKGNSLSDDELIKIMVENPDLIERPIVERGDKVVLGRPPENVFKIL